MSSVRGLDIGNIVGVQYTLGEWCPLFFEQKKLSPLLLSQCCPKEAWAIKTMCWVQFFLYLVHMSKTSLKYEICYKIINETNFSFFCILWAVSSKSCIYCSFQDHMYLVAVDWVPQPDQIILKYCGSWLSPCQWGFLSSLLCLGPFAPVFTTLGNWQIFFSCFHLLDCQFKWCFLVFLSVLCIEQCRGFERERTP